MERPRRLARRLARWARLAAVSGAAACLAAGGARGAPPVDPASSILVLPQDGRSPQTVPVVQRDDGRYMPLISFARALGVRFSWDPFTYRGWIESDSVHVRFALDSPFLMHGNDGRQITSPVIYGAEGVLLPLDILDVLEERWNGDRGVSWEPEAGRFVWGDSKLASFHQLRVTHLGHRTTLRIPGRPSPRGTLRWSPVAGLEVLLDGWSAVPESLSIGPPRGTLAVQEVAPQPGGSRIRVSVGTAALGASARYDEREQTFELTATTLRGEVERGGFRPLSRVPAPTWGVAGPVVIAFWTDGASGPAEAAQSLRDLAHRVAEILSSDFGLGSTVIEDVDPLAAAGRANTLGARCFVGLRLDVYPGARGIQVWRAAPRLRWDALDGSVSSRGERPLLWSETPAMTEGASRELATTLLDHLATVGGQNSPASFQTGRRPTRYLEGLSMPAVMLYPAASNDEVSLERLLRADLREELGRAVAFGIAEALRFEVPSSREAP